MRDIIYSLNYINVKVLTPPKKFNYDKIIITWAFQNNFEKDGSLNDRYFNINSSCLNKTLWFVVYLSPINPKVVGENIVLLPIPGSPVN